jgi:pimeloyl-ACP methyl ester carboxylesterase
MTDIELRFGEAGKGLPVVLLHGYPFDRSMWREQIDYLKTQGYRAVAPDLRGFGESPRGSGTSTMTEMAEDVLALMDRLEIDRAIVCGLSMGGYVALEFIHQFPSRVRAIVLAGTRAPADSEEPRFEKRGLHLVL